MFPEQASTIAGRVDALYMFLIGVSSFFGILIAVVLVVFAIRYRRREGGAAAVQLHGSLALEVLWSVIPFALTMVMFAWGASVFASLRRPPDDAMQILVVGKQWMWKVQHLQGKREINELHVPLGRPVSLLLTSEDVIHSFYVPAFRIKQDAVPGRYTTAWFEATRPGRYHLFCAEYCGTDHSRMIGWVEVMEPAAYQAWLTQTGPTGASRPLTLADRGAVLFDGLGCRPCHSGSGPGALGPSLAGVYESAVELADGQRVVADPTYLRESILNPQAKLVAGFDPLMPTFKGKITEEQILQLIAYIRSLQAGEGES